MKRNVYIFNSGTDTVYFGTMKKAHSFCIEKKLPVHKTFATFKKWLTRDGLYQITDFDGPINAYITFSELL